jgi:hypothetical protein
VRRQLREALDRAPPGPIAAISLCAGQGHDLIGTLPGHPRSDDVSALLVELDPDNVRAATAAARAAGLDRIRTVCADGSRSDSYASAVPADIVLVCGVFGNISAQDVERTIDRLDRLCAPGATVIWTRHRNPPDLVPRIAEAFASAGFAPLALEDAPHLAVGSNRLERAPRPFRPGETLFEFIGHRALWPHLSPQRRTALQALFRPDCTLPELVEAVRALQAGGDRQQTVESMLREARGLPASRHLFLAQVIGRRFPGTGPRLIHRVHQLDPATAAGIYGDDVARAVPPEGLIDVHRYLTADLGAGRIAIDASATGPACDPVARAPLLDALSRAGLP